MYFLLDSTLRGQILDRLLGGQSLTALPADWQLSLWSGDPLNGGTEISGTNYARQVFTGTNWVTVGDVRWNQPAIRWPASGTAGGAGWTGPMSHLGLSAVAGTPRISVLGFNGTYTLANGQYAEIPNGSLQIGLVRDGGMDLSTTLSRALLAWLLGGGAGAAFTIPATWEVSLWVGDPMQGGAEVYDPEYARLTRDNDLTEWAAASGGKTNLTELRWPATGNPIREWGNVSHVGLCNPSDTRPMIALPLGAARRVGPGAALTFAPGDITAAWAS